MEEDKALKEIVVFGWKNFLFEGLIFIVLFLIGSQIHSYLYTFLYLGIIFISRRFIRGFHLDKRWKCILATLVIHITIFLLAKSLYDDRNTVELAISTALLFLILENSLKIGQSLRRKKQID